MQVAYAIGVAAPVAIYVNSFGTGSFKGATGDEADVKIVEMVKANFDFTPAGIIKALDLRRPIYKKTAAYGHFGRNEPEFTWEKTDKVDLLK